MKSVHAQKEGEGAQPSIGHCSSPILAHIYTSECKYWHLDATTMNCPGYDAALVLFGAHA